MPTDSIFHPLRPFPTSRLAAAIIVVLAAAACGGDGGTDPTPSPDPVQVAVSSSAQTVGAAGSTTFTATVSNASNPAVTWAASGGDVSGSGASVTWTGPVAGGSYSVTATSVEDPSKSASASASASASVTVTPVAVSVEPASVTVFREQPTTFTADAVTARRRGGLPQHDDRGRAGVGSRESARAMLLAREVTDDMQWFLHPSDDHPCNEGRTFGINPPSTADGVTFVECVAAHWGGH